MPSIWLTITKTAVTRIACVFGVGGLAVFAGLGTLSYRRRLSRKFGLGKPDPRAQPDREPADRGEECTHEGHRGRPRCGSVRPAGA